MTTTNRLEASGLLYEGSDYSKWVDTLKPILVQHFPGLSITPLRNPALAYSITNLPQNVSESDICDGIWWQVSPFVRSRVSEECRKSPTLLLPVLHTTARPFRFMNLPTELRLRVYQLAFAAETYTRTFTLLKPRPGQLPPSFEYNHDSLIEPQILSISRQVRAEGLSAYYRESHVELLFNKRVTSVRALHVLDDRTRRAQLGNGRRPRPTNAERVSAMNRWAATIKPEGTRLLRKISVQLPFLAMCSTYGREDMLHFSLRVSNGKPELHVAPHEWLKPASQELLRDHASAISNLAHTLKLEGEALIMVLMSRPDIWDQLELADE